MLFTGIILYLPWGPGHPKLLGKLGQMDAADGINIRFNQLRPIFPTETVVRFSPSQISDTPRVGFEPAQNLNSGFVELSCAVVITTTL